MSRASLLQPGRTPLALPRAEWWALAALYIAAFALRWIIRASQPYTAEASHFAVSLGLWDGTTNIGSLHDVPHEDFSWFFWQRPLLTLPFWPFAHMGFEAYRTAHILLTSALAPLAVLLLRQLGTARPYAYAAGAVLLLHPALLPWTVIVLPDAMVALATIGALLLAHHGRLGWAAVVCLAAGWIKEVAFVTPLVLAALVILRHGTERPWLAPRLRDPDARRFLLAAALCFLPLLFSLTRPGAVFPGFRYGVELPITLERQFLLVWLAPVALAALLRPATRRLALVALAWPAFFIAYTLVTGKAIEIWYNVVPATMTAVAAAACLGVPPERPTPVPRPWAPFIGLALALLLIGQVTLEQGDPLQRAALTPLSGTGQWNLQQVLDHEKERELDLVAAMASIPADRRAGWMVLDMDWSLVMHPVAARVDRVYKEYTPDGEWPDDFLRWWDDAIQNRTDATLVRKQAWPVNQAIRDGYAPCAAEFGNYVAIVPGPACRDRWDEMVVAMRAAQNPPA